MKRSDQRLGLAMLESCGLLSLPRWPKQKALPRPEDSAPPPPPRPSVAKTDGTA